MFPRIWWLRTNQTNGHKRQSPLVYCWLTASPPHRLAFACVFCVCFCVYFCVCFCVCFLCVYFCMFFCMFCMFVGGLCCHYCIQFTALHGCPVEWLCSVCTCIYVVMLYVRFVCDWYCNLCKQVSFVNEDMVQGN